jgi:hypothetical protein
MPAIDAVEGDVEAAAAVVVVDDEEGADELGRDAALVVLVGEAAARGRDLARDLADVDVVAEPAPEGLAADGEAARAGASDGQGVVVEAPLAEPARGRDGLVSAAARSRPSASIQPTVSGPRAG